MRRSTVVACVALVVAVGAPPIGAAGSDQRDILVQIRDQAAAIVTIARSLPASRPRTTIVRGARTIVSGARTLLQESVLDTDVVTRMRSAAARIRAAASRLRPSTRRNRIIKRARRIDALCVVLLGGAVTAPPPPDGYFSLAPQGAWSTLPGDAACSKQVHRSSWEPRPQNSAANQRTPNASAVSASFAARPRERGDGTYAARWDTWLLPRVDGNFTGTTDEIFQWAACKWGLSDNMLRGIAVRESTWFQGLTYPSGMCAIDWGCGDVFGSASADSRTYCDGVATAGGYDYQQDLGDGICPKTFSIVGVMSWDDPAWQAPAPPYPDNQNGTFPFNRDSTAFAVDYLGSYLRGCFEGWVSWMHPAGGDIWGCVGSWYSGDWHSADADGYIGRVQNEIAGHTWLDADFPGIAPGCDPTYGCPS